MNFTVLLSRPLILTSASSNLQLSPLMLFFQFSYLFLSFVSFFSTFLYFLLLYWSSYCLYFSWVQWAPLWPLLWTLSGKWLISISSRIFFFWWDYVVLSFGTYSFVSSFCFILCACFYALGKSFIFPIFEKVVLCWRWILSFNVALALSCLLNLWDCLSSMIHSWYVLVFEGVLIPVSFQREESQ